MFRRCVTRWTVDEGRKTTDDGRPGPSHSSRWKALAILETIKPAEDGDGWIVRRPAERRPGYGDAALGAAVAAGGCVQPGGGEWHERCRVTDNPWYSPSARSKSWRCACGLHSTWEDCKVPIDDIERLIDALDRLPNGFPRTPSRVELRLLAKMYSPEEAWLAGQLSGEMEPVDAIAARVGLPEKEAGTRPERDGAPRPGLVRPARAQDVLPPGAICRGQL